MRRALALSLAGLVAACTAQVASADPAPPPAAAADPRECVVLLHGVGMGAWVMQPLADALEAAGYRPINLSYPSRKMPIEQIAGEWLPVKLREGGAAAAPRVHFVAHSMGSLVTRLYLRDHRPANLGRVVMLGPPNHGSAAADRSSQSALLRALMGVNLPRLGTGETAIARQLGPADFEVGVIAGKSALNLLFRKDLGTEHDGAVTVESARLEGMRDFIVLPHSHTVMLWRSAVHAQVLAFLRDGRFVHANDAPVPAVKSPDSR